MTDSRRIVDPQCHEFTANLNYNDDGLKPWLAADRRVKDGDGSITIQNADLDTLEDSAEVKLSYQPSNLQPPERGETLAGTRVDHETVREFRINIKANDGLGERKVNYHIRPRWANLEAETNDGRTVEIPVPDELANNHTDAVSIRASGSNIPFDQYDDLLAEAADELGIRSDYFDDPHPTSNIQDAARYVRIHKDESGPIHARSGPLVGLSHVLENDRQGYRKLVQNDDDEQGRNAPGYYHTATLGPDRIQEVWPNHTLPAEVKHYLKRDALDRPTSDPLRHPKLEAAYQVSRTDETLRYDDDGIQQVSKELDEILYSVLADAGISLRGGDGSPYVADHYFADENAHTDASIVSLDLAQVRHEQENVVVKHLADGLSPVEQEALGTLVTDGGQVSPDEIAETNERNRDVVYRALDRMDDLVDREYGRVSLRSTYVAELVHESIKHAKDAVQRATSATAEALEAADRNLDERTSAFIAWAEKYDITYTEKDDSVKVNVGEVDADSQREARSRVKEMLREGLDLWKDMNRDEATYRAGQWTARVEVPTDRARLRSVDTDETTTEYLGGKNWKLVAT